MSCKFVCDGCGWEESARTIDDDYHKPSHWLQRETKGGLRDACSIECLTKVVNGSKRIQEQPVEVVITEKCKTVPGEKCGL